MSPTRPRNRLILLLSVIFLGAGTWPALAGSGEEPTVSTFAAKGSGRYSGDGGVATEAQLNQPRMLNFDLAGNAYIADTMNHVIRKVGTDGIITTVAGTGREGTSGDGGPAAEARLKWPHSVVVNDAGEIFIADSPNHRIRRIDPATGIITAFAGTGRSGSSGDDGPATEARLDTPKGVALDPDGNLLIADSRNHRVRKVDAATGVITTVAGTGSSGSASGSDGDGGPAVKARLFEPRTVAVDPDGNVYISEPNVHRIRKVDTRGIITLVAGTGRSGFSGDGGPAVEARLATPRGIATDGAGDLFIADSSNHRIRKVDRSGVITTVAGSSRGSGGDGGAPEDARFFGPRGVAVGLDGAVYVADTYNHKIRRITGIGVAWPVVPPPPADPRPSVPSPPAPPAPPPPPEQGVSPVPPDLNQSGQAAGTRSGYWMLRADGVVHGFGDAAVHPPAGASSAADRFVDIEATPSGAGYWLLDADGNVSAHGDAGFHGRVDRGGLSPGEVVTSLSSTPSGGGYWVFTSAGRVVPFGDAAFHGDLAGVALNGPVLDSVATPSGGGYYMVASDGGVFAFGDARFRGSMGDSPLNAPVRSLVPDGDGDGYWLVASDGGIFAFDAPFRGSMGAGPLNRPVTGMVRFGDGYLMVGADGGIFNFSSRPFHGSLGADPPVSPVVSVAAVER